MGCDEEGSKLDEVCENVRVSEGTLRSNANKGVEWWNGGLTFVE